MPTLLLLAIVGDGLSEEVTMGCEHTRSFVGLVELERLYLVEKFLRNPKPPLEDQRLVAGLLFEWDPRLPRFALYGERTQHSEIRFSHLRESIPVVSNCLEDLSDEGLLEGPLQPGFHLKLTLKGQRVIEEEWFGPEAEELILPFLVRNQNIPMSSCG